MDGIFQESLTAGLVQRISIIAVVAYFFSHTQAFRLMFKEQTTYREKITLILFFSTVSVVGTYFGIPIEGAIANVRDTGTVVAGLLGGPLVGTVTGLIAGLHRLSIGGYTAVPCGLATLIGGIAGGYIHMKTLPKTPEWITGVVTGVGVVLFNMLLVILLAEPLPVAWSLVTQVAGPMSLANFIGIAVFMIIIHNAREHQTRIAAVQTYQAFHIANAALPYFRQGLNANSALNVSKTILEMIGAAAVSITDRESVLAHVGAGDDHHGPGPIRTEATYRCLQTGAVIVGQNKQEIGCPEPGCVLKSGVVVPLTCRDQVVGTLKIYFCREELITALHVEFASGLAQIFSTQLELANLQQMTELATKAELKALRAQINPHFLFNALNTIVSLCRTDPEEARHLIIELSDFFRRSLKTARDFVSLSEELEHVDSYLALEKARFGSRLKVVTQVAAGVGDCLVPAFTLQPLVENAIKHGISSKPDGGTVCISAEYHGRYIRILVHDDGVGMNSATLSQILKPGFGKGTGVGLSNVNDRMIAIYGAAYALVISSTEGSETTVELRVPVVHEGVVA